MPKFYESPDFPAKYQVPDMEYFSYNQMPKSGYLSLTLYRYAGTHLYQWYGIPNQSIFEDAIDAPFLIIPRDLGYTVRDCISHPNYAQKDNVDLIISEYNDLHERSEANKNIIRNVLEILNRLKDVSDNPVAESLIYEAISIAETS